MAQGRLFNGILNLMRPRRRKSRMALPTWAGRR